MSRVAVNNPPKWFVAHLTTRALPETQTLIAMLAVVIFLVLPLIGILVTLTVGMVGVILIALSIAIPLLLLGGMLLGLLLAPFASLGERRRSRWLRENRN